MSEGKNQGHDPYKEERDFWTAWCEVNRSKGIDTQQLLADLNRQQIERLPSPGAREDFTELSSAGCHPYVLTLILALVQYAPLLQRLWTLMGTPEEREKTTRALERAADTLEAIFGRALAQEDQTDQEAMLAKIGRIHPARVVSELRLYIRSIELGKNLAAETKAHSLAEVAKYLLCRYVERTTGRPHDRNVSGLIGAVSGPPDYNEVAHRMWRNRHDQHLEEHFSGLADLLFAMAQVIDLPPA